MSELKDRLRADMTTAMKSRETERLSTLRMALTAVTNAEVAGDEARELSDDEVIAVLEREAKKRRESAEAYDEAGRPELAAKERTEAEIIAEYLPAQLTDDEIEEIVRDAIAETGATSMRDMGKVMKIVQARTKGRAEGSRLAGVVRGHLG